MKKKIAIIGANKPLESFYRQTKKLGYEIHSFAWEDGAVCKKYADFFYPISFTRKDEILKQCIKIGIDGITSFSLESALPTVNYIARKMALVGDPINCEKLTKNKFEMRKQLKNTGIKVPNFHLIKSESELSNNIYKYPLIVKPIDSGGSRGITKVNSFNELNKAYHRALQYSTEKGVLIEQFIDGREFSVEYMSHAGIHYFIAITDKVTTGSPYFVELEHHQPAAVNYQGAKIIKEVTEKTLSALNILNSASHTELKIDNKGEIYIIEVGARMGGDMITSDLVKLSTGYDFVKGVLQLATGEFTPPSLKHKKYSGIYYLSKQSIVVLNYINNYNNFPEIVSVELNSDEIKDLKESNDRSGYFIYKSNRRFYLT